jgi:HEAT repeat protein
MQSAVHDWPHTLLWQHLLRCYGVHRWEAETGKTGGQGQLLLNDIATASRIDQSITQLFVDDESETEHTAKDVVLRLGLANPEAGIRHAAACLLGMRGDLSSIPFLEQVIDHANSNWKLRAVIALATLDSEDCGPPLVRALAHVDPKVHRAAGRALEELGKKAENAMIEALNHPRSHIRWHAARLLGMTGDLRALPMLADGLTDPDQSVRWASATSLAEIGEPAVPVLLDVIRTHEMDEQLRQILYHALHAMPPAERERLKELIIELSSPTSSVNAPAIASRISLNQ